MSRFTMGPELVKVATEAAEAAGVVLLRRFRSTDLMVREKNGPLGLVTDADFEADEAIRGVLQKRRPQDGFLSEEGARRPGTSGVDWVIDPLDSTANFARGLPTWSVSLAAKVSGEVVAGVVAAPATRELYGAHIGGALQSPEGPVPLRHRATTLESAVGIVAWDRQLSRDRFAHVFGELVMKSGRIRSPGSPALGLTWVAAGYADFGYFELDFNEWDYAAGYFLCENSGLQTRFRERDGIKQVLVAPATLFPELQTHLFAG